MIVPPTPVVPRRSVIPESPIIATLPVLAALDTPALLEVDRCEFRRARVRCQIKALCLERLGRCIARYRSATCLRSRGLAWLCRSLKLGLPGGCGRGLAWFRRSLNLSLPGGCGRGLAWFRRSLNLGLPGCCRRGLAWFRRSLDLGLSGCCRRGLAWFGRSLNLGVSGCRRGRGWFRHSLDLGRFAAGRDVCAAGAARFVGAGFFFSCCAPLAAKVSARLQNNAKSILIVFSFLSSRLLDS